VESKLEAVWTWVKRIAAAIVVVLLAVVSLVVYRKIKRYSMRHNVASPVPFSTIPGNDHEIIAVQDGEEITVILPDGVKPGEVDAVGLDTGATYAHVQIKHQPVDRRGASRSNP